jgi:hypothetical protein
MAQQNGLQGIPKTVLELGPGHSLGVGLTALLWGANQYYAFDRVPQTEPKKNLRLLDELVELFQSHHQNLPYERVQSLRKALTQTGQTEGLTVAYVAPWDGTSYEPVRPDSVDMIYSHAVLEYVSMEDTYSLFQRWLKPGGVMSHQIDFSCHTLARQWNGHWAYPTKTWRYLEGTRPYRLNRQPHSAHVDQLKRHGFRLVCDLPTIDQSGIQRRELTTEFGHLTDEDLATRSAFMQAIKNT